MIIPLNVHQVACGYSTLPQKLMVYLDQIAIIKAATNDKRSIKKYFILVIYFICDWPLHLMLQSVLCMVL